MTQTIEQLTARVRELEEENARLNGVIESNIDDGIDKIMAMSDEQVSALAGFEGSNPEDKATIARQCMDIAMLRVDLVASQAYAEQLREALNTWIEIASNCSIESGCCCCGESMEKHSSPMMCGHSPVDMADSVVRSAIQKTDKALALPRDTSALDAYVAKRLHDMACDKGLLRIRVEELTRQRDLAVEAITRAIDMVGHPDNIIYLQQMLDSIKESEAK